MSVQLNTNAASMDALRSSAGATSGQTPVSSPGSSTSSSSADSTVVNQAAPPAPSKGELFDFLGTLAEPLRDQLVDTIKEFLADLKGQGDTQPATGTSEVSVPTSRSGASADFATSIGQILKPDADGQVHEEELFAALAWNQVQDLAGPEAAERFLAILAEKLQDPGASAEGAAIEALQTLVSEGLVEADTGDQIYAQAFAAAQLDDQIDALYDGRGSAGDPTIAKAPIAEALAAAEAKLAAFASGSESAPSRTLESAAATGAPASKGSSGLDGGFVYKPRSESNGHLVILLPEGLTGEITSLVLRDRDGKIIEDGRSSGVANGNREHFRFDRQGGDYPDGMTVEVRLRNGETFTRQIAETSDRVEG